MSTGIGVMLMALGGDTRTAEVVSAAVGKQIVSVALMDNRLGFALSDGSRFEIWDGGQSCCENRYMTDDGNDLAYYAGATFLGAEVRDGPTTEGDGEPHEVQFLDVKTDRGVFTISTHIEHNGYYGGFWMQAREVEP